MQEKKKREKRRVIGERRRQRVNDNGGKERCEDSGKQKKREYRLESIVERGHCVRRSDLLSSVRRLGYVVSRRARLECVRVAYASRAAEAHNRYTDRVHLLPLHPSSPSDDCIGVIISAYFTLSRSRAKGNTSITAHAYLALARRASDRASFSSFCSINLKIYRWQLQIGR